MPRQTPREPGADDWAAQRIHDLREQRGWSMAKLAREITAAGVPMRQQAIWQIENSTPPRRISLGEALAFCQVFDIEDVADLGKPPEEVAAGLVREIQVASAEWEQSGRDLVDLLSGILIQSNADPGAYQPVLGKLRAQIADLDDVVAGIKQMFAALANPGGNSAVDPEKYRA